MKFARLVGLLPRHIGVTVLASLALIVPAAALAGAEQIVDTWQDAPISFDFVDPCSGQELHAEGTESGVLRITDLGAEGFHLRLRATGTVDLYDGAGSFFGTWSYAVNIGDQFPPDGQGAFHFISVGPIEYADGETSVIQMHGHVVFEKGDIVKRAFDKATCVG